MLSEKMKFYGLAFIAGLCPAPLSFPLFYYETKDYLTIQFGISEAHYQYDAGAFFVYPSESFSKVWPPTYDVMKNVEFGLYFISFFAFVALMYKGYRCRIPIFVSLCNTFLRPLHGVLKFIGTANIYWISKSVVFIGSALTTLYFASSIGETIPNISGLSGKTPTREWGPEIGFYLMCMPWSLMLLYYLKIKIFGDKKQTPPPLSKSVVAVIDD